jgi:predicted alpha/beta-fold hydrolase
MERGALDERERLDRGAPFSSKRDKLAAVRPQDFRPLVRDGHLQTLLGTLLRRTPRVRTTHERWETPDADVLDVERLPRREGRAGVVVLHGLEGSSRARYVLGMLGEIHARGWNGVAVNFRSCGPSEHRHARTYHSGFTRDLEFVIERLGREGLRPLGIVGFSLGGNVTVKFMGDRGDQAGVDAAVAISVPFDLSQCASTLDGDGAWPWIYRTAFLLSLKRKALRSARRFPGTLDAAAIHAARTFHEFDECVTAKLFGFASAEDYWARSSSARSVAGIRKPTLLLSAADDPLIPHASIPGEAVAGNSAVTLAVLPHGGHVGFVAGSFCSPVYAAERIAADFLASHLAPPATTAPA